MASSRKSNLADTVAARLAPLLPTQSSILVGLSGGMDSVVLLHLLHELAPRHQWRLSALHVHHGISPNANAWAEFCETLCAKLNIPLHIERVDIAPLRDAHGIEAAARKLRHAAFAKKACDFVALAHHADDQAETLLLQLLRGAGIKGAAAMPVLSRVEGPVLITSDLPACGLSRMASSSISGVEGPVFKPATGKISATVRPLLDVAREQLFDYARQHGLSWIEDESNADDYYPRNFLRHRLLPSLQEKFPAYRDTLTRSARHFAEANALLEELARLDMQGNTSDGQLDVSILRALSHQRAKNLLRYFLHTQQARMPQETQLDDMLRQLCAAREDAAVCIAYGDWEVRRFRDKVYALRALGEFDSNIELFWRGETALNWAPLHWQLSFTRTQGQGISLEKLQRAQVSLRLRSGGETLRPHANAATRSLKNLLQQHGVPPWERERLPLLYCGDELACVVGVAVHADYQAQHDEESVLVSCGKFDYDAANKNM